MAYDNLKLLVTGISNTIYLTKPNKDGITMSMTRRDMTDDAIRAVTQCLINKHNDDKTFHGYYFEDFGGILGTSLSDDKFQKVIDYIDKLESEDENGD